MSVNISELATPTVVGDMGGLATITYIAGYSAASGCGVIFAPAVGAVAGGIAAGAVIGKTLGYLFS